MFEAEKSLASSWFKTLRDEIVNALDTEIKSILLSGIIALKPLNKIPTELKLAKPHSA